MKLLLLLAIFVAPMGANAFSISLGEVELSLFRMLIILSLAFLLLKGLKHKIVIFTSQTRYSICFMLLWFIVALVSVLWAEDMGSYIKNLFFLFIGMIAPILLLNTFSTLHDFKNVFWAFLAGVFLQSLIGWYEIVFRQYHFVELEGYIKEYYTTGADRIPIAMCGNPNDFATLMMFGSFVAFACLLLAKSRIAKLFCFGMMANCALLIIMTTSRANLLGWMIGAGVLVLLSKRKKQILPIVITLGIILAPVAIWIVWGYLQEKIGMGEGSDFVRLNLIKNGFIFLKRTFGFGVGAGQIGYWMKERAIYPTDGISDMHNWWMECLTGYGVLLFVCYLVFYARLFLSFFATANHSKNHQAKSYAVALCAIMAGFVIASISSSSNITSEWLWMFWGMAILLQSMLKNREPLPSAL